MRMHITRLDFSRPSVAAVSEEKTEKKRRATYTTTRAWSLLDIKSTPRHTSKSARMCTLPSIESDARLPSTITIPGTNLLSSNTLYLTSMQDI
jgi:hypothetical protein